VYREKIIFNAGCLQIDEVVIDEEERIPMCLKLFLGYLNRFGVSIETEQLTSGETAFQYGPGVSTTTHRAIDIAAPGLDRKRLHGLFEHNRDMI
jgi:hypothetical protein